MGDPHKHNNKKNDLMDIAINYLVSMNIYCQWKQYCNRVESSWKGEMNKDWIKKKTENQNKEKKCINPNNNSRMSFMGYGWWQMVKSCMFSYMQMGTNQFQSYRSNQNKTKKKNCDRRPKPIDMNGVRVHKKSVIDILSNEGTKYPHQKKR